MCPLSRDRQRAETLSRVIRSCPASGQQLRPGGREAARSRPGPEPPSAFFVHCQPSCLPPSWLLLPLELREMPGFLALAPNFRACSSRCRLLPATVGTWPSPFPWDCSRSELIHPPHICIPQMMPNKYNRYKNKVVSTYMHLHMCVCTHPSRRGVRKAAARGAGGNKTLGGAEQGAPGPCWHPACVAAVRPLRSVNKANAQLKLSLKASERFGWCLLKI